MKSLFSFLALVGFVALVGSKGEAKTLTLTVPDQFCGPTVVSPNFDGSVSISRPHLMAGGACLPVKYVTFFESYGGLCSLVQTQGGQKFKPVGVAQAELVQAKAGISLDSNGRLLGIVENTGGGRGGSPGVYAFVLGTCAP